MPPPKKCRRVCFIPENREFIPEIDSNHKVVITIEEAEAIRLSDLEEMEQTIAADEMNISRGTYQRILNQARFKLADALINGKAINIDGGNYEKSACSGKCKRCRNCHRHDQLHCRKEYD